MRFEFYDLHFSQTHSTVYHWWTKLQREIICSFSLSSCRKNYQFSTFAHTDIKQPTVSQFRHTESDFAKHFTNKVNTIRTATATASPPDIRNRPSSILSAFQPVTTNEILRLIRKAPCKHCPLDPMPTWLVKRAADVLAPVITNVCNASLQTGHFPDSQKQARMTARLKKPSLNPDDLNSFRPISNLTFLSKIIERIATKQLTLHADQNELFPARQSAYNNNNKQIYKAPCMPTEGCRGAGVVSVRRFGDSN